MKMSKRTRFATLAPMTILALTVLTLGPVHAHPPNWHASFSNTVNTPGNRTMYFGDWGSCDFGGGTGSPATSGTVAHCEMELHANGNLTVHSSIDGTAWDMQFANSHPPIPGVPDDFFITAGTMSITVPKAASLPPPPGATQVCTINGNTATCPLSFWESLGLYNPDTVIPAAAGHYQEPIPPGTVGELNIQVTQMS